MSLFLIALDTDVPNVPRSVVGFCHIPKTAGRSIRQGRQVVDHPTLYDPIYGGRDITNSFAVVRDPYFRAESAWRDFRYTRNLTGLRFEDFLRYGFDHMSKSALNDVASVTHHIAPMTHPVHGLCHARHLIHFNNLYAGLDSYCHLMGASALNLPRIGASKGPRVELTGRICRLVDQLYEEDYNFLSQLPSRWLEPVVENPLYHRR